MGLSMFFTLASKAVGYLRQLLVAFFYGVSRDLDIYLMAFSLTMLLIFAYTTWFDQIAVARLVQTYEKEGEERFQSLSASLFSFSVLTGMVLALLFIIVFPIACWALSHGFAPAERLRVRHMAMFFLPWILIIFPYSAASAIVKSRRYYDVAMLADFIVSLVATAGFAIAHRHLVSLPLALGAGYLLSLTGLVAFCLRFTPLIGSVWTEQIRPVYRNFRELFLVNQMGNLGNAFDRFFQSHLIPGSISAYNYALQAQAPLQEFLAFDELFIVPLSSEQQRIQKLQRLISGILLLTVPLTFFLFTCSSDIVQFFYERGHFDVSARVLTSGVFRVLAFGIVSAAIGTPLARMLQIFDRQVYNGVISLGSSVLFLLLNMLFVFRLKMDVLGIACALVAKSYFSALFALYWLHHFSVRMDYLRLLTYLGYALIVALIAVRVVCWLPRLNSSLVNLLIAGTAFGAIVTLLYWPVRANIKFIVYG